MTISITDLKIFRAQRNRDTADGGGAMSPNEVVGGELNNVFDDVSSEDRVTGRVSIRKVFPGVFSDNTDRFFGAGLLIINPAQDDAVDVLMTRNTKYDDERAEVVERIESFLVPGPSIRWRLFNDHLAGTGALTLYGLSSIPTPDLGDTLFLEDSDEVQETEAVKIRKIVSRSPQTFFDNNGAFQRDVMVLELSRPLQADWDGTEVFRNTTSTPPTLIKNSTVSAGAQYFGVKRVQGDIAQGDLSVQVDNPFSRIVPSTNAEEPVTDQPASLPGIAFKAAGDPGSISVSTGSFSASAGTAETVFIGGTILPGDLEISGTFSATDDGAGNLVISGTRYSGAVDYDAGAISVVDNQGGSINLTIVATPAAAVQDSTLTTQILVREQTRALNYIRTLRPVPAPGTVSVDYRALNNWFRLSDDGSGSLAGRQPGEGGGSINYATGTLTATLAALPDVGTTVIISWGTPVVVDEGTTSVDAARPHFELNIPEFPIVPGSLDLDYISGVDTVNLTTNAAGQVMDGSDKVGIYTAQTGKVSFRPLAGRWPDAGEPINYALQRDAQQQEQLQPTPSGTSDQVNFTLANAPVEPGSAEFEWVVEAQVNGRLRLIELRIYDDGAGGLQYANGAPVPGGTINYTTGEVDFPAAIDGGNA